MDKYLTPDTNFLDVGTGSGILMVTAALLENRHMVGIDNDPVAVTVAKQNLDNNKISSKTYELSCTTLDKTEIQPFDFIAANIIAQVIVNILSDIALRMTDQTVTFLSGIIDERLPDVMAAVEKNHLTVIEKMIDQDWVALAVKKIN